MEQTETYKAEENSEEYKQMEFDQSEEGIYANDGEVCACCGCLNCVHEA